MRSDTDTPSTTLIVQQKIPTSLSLCPCGITRVLVQTGTNQFLSNPPKYLMSINPSINSIDYSPLLPFCSTSSQTMGKLQYLAMKTDSPNYDQINSDLTELGNAARNLASHAVSLAGGLGLGFGSMFLQWLASIAAIYLLVLDRTNWRTNILTSLLIPYIFLSLPGVIFSFLRGEVGIWIAFVAVVLRLFFPRNFPDWLELPSALILLLVVAPSFFVYTVRDGIIGVLICLVIGCYLLQEHIRASGGFRNSFTQAHGVSNTVGIVLLLVYPVWRLVLSFL